ncbi:MAG: aldo/keto reductase [Acidimicrobiaceae bacterium]|nr:aldo/keto reductase [Acidimicrobiaceae bacterium]
MAEISGVGRPRLSAPASGDPLADRRRLGSSSVSVGPMVLGTGAIGGLYSAVSDAQSEETFAEAWHLGIRDFDTAPHYGAGVAERRLGAFLASRPRSEFVLSTKVGRLLVQGPGDEPPTFVGESGLSRVWDFSAAGVRRSLEESLERLGLERIDIALVHDPDDHLDEAIGEALPTLAALRDEGIVGAIGAGMNLCAPLERIVTETDVDCVLVAGRYSLLEREAAESLLPACMEAGVSVLAGAVLHGDVLADPRPGAHFAYRPASEAVLARAREIQDLCARHGASLLSAALQFPLRHPAVTAIVVGARTAGEIAEDVAALRAELPEELFAELEESA